LAEAPGHQAVHLPEQGLLVSHLQQTAQVADLQAADASLARVQQPASTLARSNNTSTSGMPSQVGSRLQLLKPQPGAEPVLLCSSTARRQPADNSTRGIDQHIRCSSTQPPNADMPLVCSPAIAALAASCPVGCCCRGCGGCAAGSSSG
jgi:hypothetical protein